MTLSVLMVCPAFRPIVGGAERQAERLSHELISKGVSVTVLTPQLVAGSPILERDGELTIHRFRLFDLCRKFPRLRGLGPLNLALIGAQVQRVLASHLVGTDIVHTHIASSVTAFAAKAAKRQGRPVLCKPASSGAGSDLSNLASITVGAGHLSKFMIREVDQWVATTQAVAESLRGAEVAPERIACIPNGVSVSEPQSLESQQRVVKRFLYLGRLATTAHRDVPTLIRAFDRLADENSEVELAVVGAGDLFAETANIVSACRHSDRIKLPGFQKPEVWLQWAEGFVLPSRVEGLSNALLEAMSYGLFCIANDIPPNREALDAGAAGMLVPVGDEEMLLAAMRRGVTDVDYVVSKRSAAVDRVQQNYSLSAVADRYISLYQSLLID